MTRSKLIIGLLSSTALSLGAAGQVWAQAEQATGQAGQLQEVVVTATRQSSTVNKVPLSVTAQTQQTLDQQGVKTIADLQRIAPALTVSGGFGGVQNFSVRGIVSTQGAATTGVYLDDVALQKRFAAGPTGTTTGSGTPAPPLFDLDRVEILRGPQGTLYGGSSEGGTLRFITPAPSLTRYSGYARAEISTVKDGGVSGEGGVAVGGPIVQDKLGFRLSVFDRRTAGYVDLLDPYRNGALVKKDANWTDTNSIHGSLLWAPTDRLRVTASAYASYVKDGGGTNQWTLPVAGTFTTPASCYNTTRQFGQSPAPTAAVACPANAIAGQVVNGIYQRPSATYGPFPYLGRDKALAIATAPVKTKTDIASLTLDYDFGRITLKSITAYLHDETNAVNGVGAVQTLANRQVTTAFPTASGFPLFGAVPSFAGSIISRNHRDGVTQELRLATTPGAGPLNVVAGVYFSRIRNEAAYALPYDITSQQSFPLFGITAQQLYGVPQVGVPNQRVQTLKDREDAVFGEASYAITEKLTAIAGLRASRVSFSFHQAMFGAANGYNIPTLANLGLSQGQVTAHPVTPKFALQYQFTPSQMVYVTASKGFRAGGVNTPLTANLCAPGLAAAGLTLADIPTTYGPDSVWSYEGGAKFRLFNGRVQMNASAFKIDWTGVQLTVSGVAGCPNNWVQNAGKATSKGFDFDGQAKLFGGLSATLSLGYTDAQYTETVRAPAPAGTLGTPIVRDGDTFPVPKWQVALGLRYDFMVSGRYGAYVRGDFFYQGKYLRSLGPGVSTFAPDTYQAGATRQLNVRAGMTMGSWDVNLFVNNLLDSQDVVTRGGALGVGSGGRSGCSVAQGADCTTFTGYNPFIGVGTLRPREVGLQTSYRF